MSETWVLGLGFGAERRHQAKAARVIETKLVAVVEIPHHMIVSREGPRGSGEPKPSGHAQMQEHHAAEVEVNEEVFGAPAHAQHGAALHPTFERAHVHGGAQASLPHLHPLDATPAQMRHQAPAHRLDLRQLGHVKIRCA